MYRLEPVDFVKPRFIGLWALLAFQAGFINSLGFLACHRFVSHVTGFGTQVGISLGEGRYWYALEMFSAPLAFIMGAWFNGFLTVARRSRGLAPRYDLVTLLMPLAIFLLMLGGAKGFFGTFGEPLEFGRDFFLLGSLSFLCGMQNACFATLTKGQIRTTHLTGISTDLGTDLALTLHGGLGPDERRLAILRNLMRIITFSAFSTGALLSAVIDSNMGYLSFLIPMATSLTVAAIFFVVRYEIEPDSAGDPVTAASAAPCRNDLKAT
jgi:uncharacterized membrane protein YoaK (UPF0700 family)